MIEWSALGQVAIAGIILGAGLPALFALGTKLISSSVAADGSTTAQTAARKVGAYVCFGICILAVAIGVIFLAKGGHS